MRINSDDIRSQVEQVRRMLQEESTLSPALRAAMEMLLLVVTILLNRIGLNSRNSSKSPSNDPNREKKPSNGNGNNPGGQKGHRGANLEPVTDPDEIVFLQWDMTTLPHGIYREEGFE
ncbi:MAG: IS66 family transposase, partial [Magnetococcales bacterium]|nr:IS66 family transposase [Magnetococcales bacterium]